MYLRARGPGPERRRALGSLRRRPPRFASPVRRRRPRRTPARLGPPCVRRSRPRVREPRASTAPPRPKCCAKAAARPSDERPVRAAFVSRMLRLVSPKKKPKPKPKPKPTKPPDGGTFDVEWIVEGPVLL